MWGPLAYMNLASTGEVIFNWFVSLSGLAALFTWGSICLAHIRFRKAWAYHGHTLDEIPFKAAGGVIGSWIGIIIIIIVLMAQVRLPPIASVVQSANMNISSTLPFPLLERGLVLPPTSSRHTSPSSSLLLSGLPDTSGSARDGSELPRWTLTLAVVSSTGTSSTRSVPRSPPGPHGSVS